MLGVGGWQLPGGYEDWDLWLTLAESGHEGVGIPAVTGAYRVRPGSRVSRSSRRHGERCAALRERHPRLYAERRRHRRASPAPRVLKLALPVIDVLPVGAHRRRLLAGAVYHLAQGAGLPTIAARLRALRIRHARVSGQRRARMAATQMRAATSQRCRQCSASTNAALASRPHHAPSSTAEPTP